LLVLVVGKAKYPWHWWGRWWGKETGVTQRLPKMVAHGKSPYGD